MTEPDRVPARPRSDGGSQAAASTPPANWMPRNADTVRDEAPATRRHGIIIRMG